MKLTLLGTGSPVPMINRASSGYLIEINLKQARLNELAETYELVSKRSASAQQKIDNLGVMKDYIEGRVFMPDVIEEIQNITPQEMSFRSLHLSDTGKLVLQGYSTDSKGVNKFQEKLLKSEVFEDVNLLFSTRRKIYNKQLIDFKFECQLTKKANNE